MAAQPKPQPAQDHTASDTMWNEYAAATTAHLNLQLELYMAVASNHTDLEDRLNELLVEAEQRRLLARKLIRETETH